MSTQNAINWQDKYLPGTTDNYVANETYVRGLWAADAWPYLINAVGWPSYYDNSSDVSFPEGGGPDLADGLRFSFATFGFPPLDARVVEFVPPSAGQPARLSWTAKQDGRPEDRLDVMHAWLLEDMPGDRLRILTQESQIGQPAAQLAGQRPNPMLNGHQAWLDGLVKATREGMLTGAAR